MDPARGLDEAEAARRLAAGGPNALPAPRSRGLLRFVAEVFEEPIFGLLVGAALLYVAIGDVAEGLLLAGCAGVSVALVAVQSWRSERVLTALKGVIAPRARVVRGGVARRIPATEIVPGDIVVLAAGDRVPADGVVRQGAGLIVDESALTGESVPVRKTAAAHDADTEQPTPGGDDTPWIFSGTLVLSGEGLAEILATGSRTRIGAIGTALVAIDWPTTPLQQAMTRVVRRMAAGALALSVLLALLRGLRDGDWLGGALAGITLAMSAIPEELPMVLAIFLAVGGWRLSRHGVLARQPSAVLALGATTVLCVDKTGTITQNTIRLERVAVPGAAATPDAARDDTRFAALCAGAPRAAHPQGGDPMDRATLTLAAAGTGPVPGAAPLHEYPLTAENPRVAFAWASPQGVLIAAKGAPETIARLCRLDDAALAAMQAQLQDFAAAGLRVLAVAEARVAAVPDAVEGLDFAYLGLLGFGDPVRDSARGAIDECRAAGIDVVMITGDHPATAAAIADRAGIDGGGRTISGRDLARLDGDALARAVDTSRVFARTEPGQKLRIVEALQGRGHVVAMTGDGVNDAPALRAAHVGVAMGSRGTDVAREAAGLVVLNDDLGSIVAAIRLGRRIADNLRKAMVFVVAIHIPLIGLALLPALLGWPPLLSPVHVIFLELFIDPTCAIVFESLREEPGTMRRKPRSARHAVVSPLIVAVGAAQGAVLLASVAGLYGWALGAGMTGDAARALGFVTLVAGTLGLALTNLSWGRGAFAPSVLAHPAFLIAAGATAALLALLLAWPPARAMFGFAPLGIPALAGAIALGLAATLWFEAVKASGLLARR